MSRSRARRERVSSRLGAFAWWRGDSGIVFASSAVQQWNDRTGRGRNVSQGTAADRPAHLATGGPGGQPCVQFDGTDDSLTATFTLNQPEELFWVGRVSRAQVAAGQTLIDGSATNTLRVFCSGADNTIAAFAGLQLTTVGPTIRVFHIGNVQYNGASSVHRVDTTEATGDLGASNAGGIKFGVLGSGVANFADGDLAEVVLYDRMLTAHERGRQRDQLSRRYGLAA